MNGFLKPYQVESIKQKYPIGTRIELDFMNEKDMPSGLRGTVDFIDDQGQLHMKWQNGRSLALVPNEDEFHVLPPLTQEKETEKAMQDGEGCDTSLNEEQIGRYMERFGAPEQHSDDEAHQYAYEVKAALSSVDFLRMLGLVQHVDDSEDEMER